MAVLSFGIVGAGIGGLTAALALVQAGHQVTLIEHRTGFTEIGAGIQISPNASRLLFALGLGPALKRKATAPDQMVVRDLRSGKIISQMPLGEVIDRRFGVPSFVIHRADLQTLLLDAVRSWPSVRLLMGRKASPPLDRGDKASVTITAQNGQIETLAFDGIIGADGLWSAVRTTLGEKTNPTYQGSVAWRALVPRETVPPALAGNESGLWLGSQGHVVHYPVAGGSLFNLVAIERRNEPVEGWAVPGERKTLLSHFAQAAPLLKEALRLPESWLLWSLYDRPAGRLARGRVALVGDSAHPILPFLAQGAALAIEDALCLTSCLTNRNLPEAFAAYETARRDRIRKVQRESRRNGRLYGMKGPFALTRNIALQRMKPEGLLERYAWLYGHDARVS